MNPLTKSIEHRFGLWLQWIAAIEIFLIEGMIGLLAGWSSPFLAKLTKPNSTVEITLDEASWIASLINIARPLGAIMGAALVYFKGSKLSTLASGIPFALAWMCFFISNAVPLIYFSRTLSGIGVGMLYSSFPLYMGEISSPKIRGALVSFIMQGVTIGNLIGNIAGTYLDLSGFAAVSLVPNLIFIIFFAIMPQTPHHLIRAKRYDEAAKSIKAYNRNADVKQELESLRFFLENDKTMNIYETMRDMNTPVNRKSLIMVTLIMVFVQSSGLYTVAAYMEIIFTANQVTVIAPAMMVIIVSILGIIASIASMYANDKYGRKIMLTLSSFGVATGMFLWGLNYYLLELGIENPHLQWMSISAALIYQITVAIGLMQVPMTIVSEMFAPNIKSFGACICNIVSAICAFTVSRTYQIMVDLITEKYVFWLYSLSMVSLAVYTMIYIPETKGKSLAEIQTMLIKQSKKKDLDVKNNSSDNNFRNDSKLEKA
ncbi:facilitated trehalose transporter Tret1-like [Chelonus insularis]|uniref:facilitated trehalose transporter Tret1-like n=1 Tax=Chelonus insularis TaxID=460826 RepID=UPI00158CDAA8|nr:facilitated trehalose transporter Tret1-like [Chelonus insularis]